MIDFDLQSVDFTFVSCQHGDPQLLPVEALGGFGDTSELIEHESADDVEIAFFGQVVAELFVQVVDVHPGCDLG